AASIAPSAGDHQTATVGTAVATPPAVIVRDQFNNPVAGVAVTFAPAAGSGSVSPTTPILTNASGVAALTSWTLGTTARSNSLTATSAGLTGSPVAFTATGTAGAASEMALNAGNDQAATVGTAVVTPPSVMVRDQFANPVPGAAVTFATTGANGPVDPPATGSTVTQPVGTTSPGGQITGSLSSTAAGTKTVSAIVNGTLTVAQTASVTVNPAGASASQSLVAASPGTITASNGSSASTIT